jgi:hypothetical protein
MCRIGRSRWTSALVGLVLMGGMLTGTGAGLFKLGEALAALPAATR